MKKQKKIKINALPDIVRVAEEQGIQVHREGNKVYFIDLNKLKLVEK